MYFYYQIRIKTICDKYNPPPFFHAFIFRKSQIKKPQGGFIKGGVVSMSTVLWQSGFWVKKRYQTPKPSKLPVGTAFAERRKVFATGEGEGRKGKAGVRAADELCREYFGYKTFSLRETGNLMLEPEASLIVEWKRWFRKRYLYWSLVEMTQPGRWNLSCTEKERRENVLSALV